MLFLSVFPALAQDEVAESRIAYNKAEGFYSIGRFDEAIKTLDQNGSVSLPAIQNNVLRLYALCYLETDNLEMCREYALRLLDANPGYTSVNDPPRFRDLIEELKKGANATISTASFSSESVEEAPVPVTVITEDMIRAAGAQTIQDALIAYVPGISVIENNGLKNFAYRGIYGLTQEKMLVMLNGIRLNSYYSNTSISDYSISLKKVKQIEVLRGPSSSLYGDVALTGVVNIITKDGGDLDGVEANAGVGNFGQLKAGLTVGKRVYDFDIFAWGAIYRTDGERTKGVIDSLVFWDNPYAGTLPQDIIIGGYNSKPAYDYGVNLKYKGFSVQHSCNSSKTVTPYTKTYENRFEPYSYYDYTSYYGNKPGPWYQQHNVKAMYEKDFGRLGVSASASYNREIMMRYFVDSDSARTFGYSGYKLIDFDTITFDFIYTDQFYQSGLAQIYRSEYENYTASARVNYEYGNSRIGGTVIFGVDYSFFRSLSVDTVLICHFTQPLIGNFFPTVLLGSTEPKNDFYVQIKHRFGPLIINSGLRLDYKKRCSTTFRSVDGDSDSTVAYSDRKMHEVSPRISVIYMRDRLNFKFNYSKSFVDAPYHYRLNEFIYYASERGLQPERLHSFQLTASAKNFVKGLETEINFYYNNAIGLLSTGNNETYNWDLAVVGAELVAKYSIGDFSLNASFSHLQARSFSSLGVKNGENGLTYEDDKEDHLTYRNSVFNVPNFTSNIVAGYKFFDKMRLNVKLYYTVRQYFYASYYIDDPEVWDVPQVFLVSPSLNFDFKHLTLDISVHNAFNHKYSLGGKCIRPIQQKGAWLMVEAGYKF